MEHLFFFFCYIIYSDFYCYRFLCLYINICCCCFVFSNDFLWKRLLTKNGIKEDSIVITIWNTILWWNNKL